MPLYLKPYSPKKKNHCQLIVTPFLDLSLRSICINVPRHVPFFWYAPGQPVKRSQRYKLTYGKKRRKEKWKKKARHKSGVKCSKHWLPSTRWQGGVAGRGAAEIARYAPGHAHFRASVTSNLERWRLLITSLAPASHSIDQFDRWWGQRLSWRGRDSWWG